jgi:hypothetical protein
MNFLFLIETMRSQGYPFPDYIENPQKNASADISFDDREIRWDNPANVFLSALKTACKEIPELLQDQQYRPIAEAAERYGISDDLVHALNFIKEIQTKNAGIETKQDYQEAVNFLKTHAERLDQETRTKLVEHLEDRAEKLGHILSLSDKYEFDVLAGRNPENEETKKLAEACYCELANGAIYRQDQFTPDVTRRISEVLPDMIKAASLGSLGVIPDKLKRAAESLSPSKADVLEIVLRGYGQTPVFDSRDLPVSIDDPSLTAWN